MKIKKTRVVESDLINKYLPANYVDTFEVDFCTNRPVAADDVMIGFWTSAPEWVNWLFTLRDWLVKPFGIQTGAAGKNNELFEKAIREGGSYRFVEVVDKSDTETVIAADDKHLKMYLSVKAERVGEGHHNLRISTVVHFHNWLGRAYFAVICLFHYFIVKNTIKTLVKKLYICGFCK